MNFQQPSPLLPSFQFYTMEELLNWDLESDSTLPFYDEDIKICTGMPVIHQGLLVGDDQPPQRAPASGPIRSQHQLIVQEIRKAEASNQYHKDEPSRTIKEDQSTGSLLGIARMDANDDAGAGKVWGLSVENQLIADQNSTQRMQKPYERSKRKRRTRTTVLKSKCMMILSILSIHPLLTLH